MNAPVRGWLIWLAIGMCLIAVALHFAGCSRPSNPANIARAIDCAAHPQNCN